MRKRSLGVIAGALVAFAAFASRVAPAHAVIPNTGADLGAAGGGYTLIDPAQPNVESNRARCEFAVRQSQATGLMRGKNLVVRTLR